MLSHNICWYICSSMHSVNPFVRSVDTRELWPKADRRRTVDLNISVLLYQYDASHMYICIHTQANKSFDASAQFIRALLLWRLSHLTPKRGFATLSVFFSAERRGFTCIQAPRCTMCRARKRMGDLKKNGTLKSLCSTAGGRDGIWFARSDNSHATTTWSIGQHATAIVAAAAMRCETWAVIFDIATMRQSRRDGEAVGDDFSAHSRKMSVQHQHFPQRAIGWNNFSFGGSITWIVWLFCVVLGVVFFCCALLDCMYEHTVEVPVMWILMIPLMLMVCIMLRVCIHMIHTYIHTWSCIL